MFKKFQNSVKYDKIKIEKYNSNQNLITPVPLKLNFSYLSGKKIPDKLLIEIEGFGLISAAWFDIKKCQRSIQDIVLEIKDLVGRLFRSRLRP